MAKLVNTEPLVIHRKDLILANLRAAQKYTLSTCRDITTPKTAIYSLQFIKFKPMN